MKAKLRHNANPGNSVSPVLLPSDRRVLSFIALSVFRYRLCGANAKHHAYSCMKINRHLFLLLFAWCNSGRRDSPLFSTFTASAALFGWLEVLVFPVGTSNKNQIDIFSFKTLRTRREKIHPKFVRLRARAVVNL